MSVVDESSIGVSIPSAAIGSRSNDLPVNEDGRDAEATTPVVVVEELPEETPAEPYYWEEGGNPHVDWWAKVRHAMHFGSIKAIAGAEAVGEVVANTLGLNESKYQYVIDALEADELRKQQEEQDEEDRRQMDLRDQDIHNMDQGAIEIGAACVTQPSDVEAHAGGVSGSSAVANAPMDQQI